MISLNHVLDEALQTFGTVAHGEDDFLFFAGKTLNHAPQEIKASIIYAVDAYVRKRRVEMFTEALGDLGQAAPKDAVALDTDPAVMGRLLRVSNFYGLGNTFSLLYMHADLLNKLGKPSPLAWLKGMLETMDPR